MSEGRTESKSEGKVRAYLCIGGPYDGRRHACHDLGFRVAVRQPLKAIPSADLIAELSTEVNFVQYIADRFKLQSGEIWFWRPVDQSIGETIHKLLNLYERASNINWSDKPWKD